MDFVLDTDKPYFLFSYEKAITDPANFVHSIIDYTNIKPTQEQIDAAISAIEPNYQKYQEATLVDEGKRERYTGKVEKFENGTILGWVKESNSEEPVAINVLLDDELVCSSVADIYTDNLKTRGIGNGKHAFKINISKYLTEKKEYQLTVNTKEDNIVLKNNVPTIAL